MIDKTYKNWLIGLKGKIRSAQLKAAVAVNAELICLYWDLGKMITEKQTAYGTGFLERLSKDLKAEFPAMQGFSRRTLSNTVNFYQFYSASIWQQAVAKLPQSDDAGKSQPSVDQSRTSCELIQQSAGQFWQQLVAKIPWGHNILMICKNNIIAEYALKNINQPIGVSEYQLTKLFPEEFKSSLPSIEEIENELKDE